ncbi:MAG: phytochelatin synthase family protein [Polyangiaceae bacterium]|nr:phytochelatin synthase family protein [Polyangiaceae bacterium]
MRKTRRIVVIACTSLVALGSAGFGLLYWRISNPVNERLPLPPELVSLESDEGKTLLAESDAKADTDALQAHFETQQKASWCGVASAVTVLNSFLPPLQLTQESFFNDCTAEVRSSFRVTFGGMPLGSLGRLMACHGADAKVHLAETSSLEEFRKLAVDNLRRPGDFLIVNYQRSEVGQAPLGHISPVSAYHSGSDRFLVLDVASYKYPPVWVKAEKLWNAMKTPDSESGHSRGFLFVRPAVNGNRRQP